MKERLLTTCFLELWDQKMLWTLFFYFLLRVLVWRECEKKTIVAQVECFAAFHFCYVISTAYEETTGLEHLTFRSSLRHASWVSLAFILIFPLLNENAERNAAWTNLKPSSCFGNGWLIGISQLSYLFKVSEHWVSLSLTHPTSLWAS